MNSVGDSSEFAHPDEKQLVKDEQATLSEEPPRQIHGIKVPYLTQSTGLADINMLLVVYLGGSNSIDHSSFQPRHNHSMSSYELGNVINTYKYGLKGGRRPAKYYQGFW